MPSSTHKSRAKNASDNALAKLMAELAKERDEEPER